MKIIQIESCRDCPVRYKCQYFENLPAKERAAIYDAGEIAENCPLRDAPQQCEIRTVDEIVPELDSLQAAELAESCDYAFAVSKTKPDPEGQINWVDAVAFFDEGYDHARKLLHEAKVLCQVIPELSYPKIIAAVEPPKYTETPTQWIKSTP